MCGIVGYWSGSSNTADAEIVGKMATQLAHRGPDDVGIWIDDNAGLALAHRRLSIIDLSAAGHQPMESPCGRFTITYNGEIYNHHDIRKQLIDAGHKYNWRGYSDTETLLAALTFWGIENTLSRINGMFAFAFWDSSDRTLYLARDRMGEKPLYYGVLNNVFFFSSELKALTVHPAWRVEIDRNALALYVRHNYIPEPWSIYQGIYKLPPAHFIKIRNSGSDISNVHCYWSFNKIAEGLNAHDKNTTSSEEDLIEELDVLLRDAIGRRMEADVPLGAFLSGGYDSSTVVAIMQELSERPVRTFTIGFGEQEFNEAKHAKAVAEHLGTDHTELYVSPEEAMAVIPELPNIWDEPFSDSSQIPTYLISKLARQSVTVSLSGDGGDELFCGYNRYVSGYRAWRSLNHLPLGLRKTLSYMLMHAPTKHLDKITNLLPQRLRIKNLADRLPKFAEVILHQNEEFFYRDLISHCKDPESLILNCKEPDTLLSLPDHMPDIQGLQERMMYLDTKTYLPGDILTKMDRASMAVSLEARIPLLDHHLVEFAWRVPTSLKYRNGQGKWLLRQVLYRYVPKKLMDRPKMGFGVPIEHWLRGPLREWAEDLLEEKKLREEGFFDPAPIRTMWDEHISGKRRWHYYLWDILMFQAWLHNS